MTLMMTIGVPVVEAGKIAVKRRKTNAEAVVAAVGGRSPNLNLPLVGGVVNGIGIVVEIGRRDAVIPAANQVIATAVAAAAVAVAIIPAVPPRKNVGVEKDVPNQIQKQKRTKSPLKVHVLLVAPQNQRVPPKRW